MKRRLAQGAVALLVVVAVAQLVRPDRTNPPTDPRRTIQAHAGTTPALAAVLDRSCRDCHSNETVWPWYTRIAPVSWVMASAVSEGRRVVNFSEWEAYSPTQQQGLLRASCAAARADRMPGVYARLRPDTRLSAQDIATICAATTLREE